MKHANLSFNEVYQHHNNYRFYPKIVSNIIFRTIYKPLINKDPTNVSIPGNYDLASDLWDFGFIDTKMINELYLLSDRGFQFLLWMRDNYFEKIVESLDLGSNIEKNANYIKLLISEKDLAAALSISRNPNKLLSAYNLAKNI